MAIKAVVVIPWRATPDRVAAFEMVHSRYIRLGYDVWMADSNHPQFNRAAARNVAVRIAERHHADVVVIGDADTIVEPDPMVKAITAAATSGRVHLPYTTYHRDQAGGARLDLSAFAWSGVLVATPATWWCIGGQDERFDCWSPEDYAFRFAHETLLGPMVRHEGTAVALDHRPDRGTDEQIERTTALYQRYLAARGDRAAMRGLVDERVGQRPQGASALELAGATCPGVQA